MDRADYHLQNFSFNAMAAGGAYHPPEDDQQYRLYPADRPASFVDPHHNVASTSIAFCAPRHSGPFEYIVTPQYMIPDITLRQQDKLAYVQHSNHPIFYPPGPSSLPHPPALYPQNTHIGTKGLTTTKLPPPISFSAVQYQQAQGLTKLPSLDNLVHPLFKHGIPGDRRLEQLAIVVTEQPWLKSGEPERRLKREDLVYYDLSFVEHSTSVFDAFFEANSKHRCLFTIDGKQCAHQASRPGRARSHAYYHFDYNPFVCEGQCQESQCSKRFTSIGALNDHARRRAQPTKACAECQKEITIQNLRRHMKEMH